MSILILICSTLRYYWQEYFWLILGTMTAAAIIVGALMVGDSMQYSLQKANEFRLGKIEWMLYNEYSKLRPDLLETIVSSIKKEKSIDVIGASILQLYGTPTNLKNQKKIPHTQILGIDSNWMKLVDIYSTGDIQNIQDLPEGIGLANETLMNELDLKLGDEIVVRTLKKSEMSWESPLSAKPKVIFFNVKVVGVLKNDQLGNFQFSSTASLPANLFVSRTWLNHNIGTQDFSNLFLISSKDKKNNKEISLEYLQKNLEKHWKIEDAGVYWNILENEKIELQTSNIFLQKELSEVALNAYPNSQGILTYFVNSINLKNNSTPYSFITSTDLSSLGISCQDNEIVITDWLAEDLEAVIGDEVLLKYWVMGELRQIKEEEKIFKIVKIVPIEGFFADPSLMPNFPGLKEAQSCQNWNPGVPIDVKKIRSKDEIYWQQYSGTPKAWLNLAVGQKLWSNNFGNLTAIRYPKQAQKIVTEKVLPILSPEKLGWQWLDLLSQSILSQKTNVDFGQLFLGLSLFILIAAFILIHLLFSLHWDKHQKQYIIFQKLGFSRQRIFIILILKLFPVVFISIFLGIILAIFYSYSIIQGLNSIWSSATGKLFLIWNFSWCSILIGAVASLFVIFFTLSYSTYRKCEILYKNKFFLEKESYLQKNFFRDFTIYSLAWKNMFRNSRRSLAVIIMLSFGIFIVIAVGTHQKLPENTNLASSGTGGFSFFIETTLPISYDLNTPQGRLELNLPLELPENVHIFSLRKFTGDDASCKNPYHALQPTLIAIPCKIFDKKQVFSFANILDVSTQHPWLLLEKKYPSLNDAPIIPGIIDQSVLQWGLGKKLGDVISYTDEFGKKLYIKIVATLSGSIFQGSILISEPNLKIFFPTKNNIKILLVETPTIHAEYIIDILKEQLQDFGIQLQSTSQRLIDFYSVENIYMEIFLALGSLGIILGSIGTGILLSRNIEERRNELAVLFSLGFSLKKIKYLLAFEHSLLIVCALFLGILGGMALAIPNLLISGKTIPVFIIMGLILGIFIVASLAIFCPLFFFEKKKLLTSLRSE